MEFLDSAFCQILQVEEAAGFWQRLSVEGLTSAVFQNLQVEGAAGCWHRLEVEAWVYVFPNMNLQVEAVLQISGRGGRWRKGPQLSARSCRWRRLQLADRGWRWRNGFKGFYWQRM